MGQTPIREQIVHELVVDALGCDPASVGCIVGANLIIIAQAGSLPLTSDQKLRAKVRLMNSGYHHLVRFL